MLFIQFNQSNANVKDWNDDIRANALLWLMFEVLSLYLYIFSAIVYLFLISFRGVLGNGRKQDVKGDRYKYDAIEYYKTDLDWFALIFIGFAMDSIVIAL